MPQYQRGAQQLETKPAWAGLGWAGLGWAGLGCTLPMENGDVSLLSPTLLETSGTWSYMVTTDTETVIFEDV